MSGSDFLENLAGSSAALLQDYDLSGMLIRTVGEAVAVTGAAAGGLLVVTESGDLELLSATSHSAVALETYQSFAGEGPCVECLTHQRALGFSLAETAERWPQIGTLMETAEFAFVLAAPLRWRGTTLGGLNLFWTTPPKSPDVVVPETEVFADLLSLFIVHNEPVSHAEARRQVSVALRERGIVEQAKGVLAFQQGIDMEDAYQRLRALSRERDLLLTEVARRIVQDAQNGGRAVH
jgi:hypothetical protein